MRSKKLTVIITLMLSFIMLLSILSGCVNHLEDEVIIGDFVCQEWSNGCIHLKNLSEEGKKKKYIVVPSELNGNKVMMLGYRNAMFSPGKSNWQSENLEKVYLNTKYVFTMREVFDECPKLRKCFFIDNNFEGESVFSGLAQIYKSSYEYYNYWGGTKTYQES